MNSLEMRTNKRTLEIGGKTYRLDFDMCALSLAEQVYLTHYGRDVNVAQIITEMFNAKASALGAFIYGALQSAGENLTWETFSKTMYTYANFDKFMGVALDAVEALLAPADAGPAQGNEKN